MSERRSSDRAVRACVHLLVRVCATEERRKGRKEEEEGGRNRDGQLYHAHLKGHSVIVGLHFADPPCGQLILGRHKEEREDEVRLEMWEKFSGKTAKNMQMKRLFSYVVRLVYSE